jgi:uncharacterized protein (TIGR00369 family)
MAVNDQPSLSLDAIRNSLAESPFQAPFHLQLIAFDRGTGTCELQMNFVSAAERSPGSRQFHGGAIASLVDIAGGYAILALLGHGVPTISLHVDYLRPALDTNLSARAFVRKAGRTVAVVDVEVTSSAGNVVAIGRGTYGISNKQQPA